MRTKRTEIKLSAHSPRATRLTGAPLSVHRWMTRNGMIGAFQEQAFDIQPSTVGKPIYKEIKVGSTNTLVFHAQRH